MIGLKRTKGSKYNAVKTMVDGIKFDSKLEAKHYEMLRDAGFKPKLQVKFVLQAGFRHPKTGKAIRSIECKPDFHLMHNDKSYIMDSKGMLLPEFKIKAKMFLKEYNADIICIGSQAKMLVVIDMIKQGKEPHEIIEAIKTKKKKAKR